jgi:hypothetical protein
MCSKNQYFAASEVSMKTEWMPPQYKDPGNLKT